LNHFGFAAGGFDFFQKVVDFAKENNILVIHDLAYADLVFDGYKAPSFMQVPGAKDVGVEFFSMSKSYSMPGWRVGFAVGNQKMIAAIDAAKEDGDTVGGIVVAVPVVIFYNYFVTRVNLILTKLENQVNSLVVLINAAGNGSPKRGDSEEE